MFTFLLRLVTIVRQCILPLQDRTNSADLDNHDVGAANETSTNSKEDQDDADVPAVIETITNDKEDQHHAHAPTAEHTNATNAVEAVEAVEISDDSFVSTSQPDILHSGEIRILGTPTNSTSSSPPIPLSQLQTNSPLATSSPPSPRSQQTPSSRKSSTHSRPSPLSSIRPSYPSIGYEDNIQVLPIQSSEYDDQNTNIPMAATPSECISGKRARSPTAQSEARINKLIKQDLDHSHEHGQHDETSSSVQLPNEKIKQTESMALSHTYMPLSPSTSGSEEYDQQQNENN